MSLFDDTLLVHPEEPPPIDHGHRLRRRINRAARDLGLTDGRGVPDLASSASDHFVSLATLSHAEADRLARTLEELVERGRR